MARTLILVEDDSDKYTFEAIIRHIKLQDSLSVTIPPPDTVIDWKSIADENNPLRPSGLIKGLKALRNDINIGKYDKIGIIKDMDTNRKADRLLLVNNAFREAYPDEAQPLEDVNSLTPFTFKQADSEDTIVHFACYFVHVTENGVPKGEIEDILKAIKTQDSPIADCVDAHLPTCLATNDEDELREKDLVKLWFNHYQRYDTLTKAQRKFPYTTTRFIMEQRTSLFDFDADLAPLHELKAFLQMMSE
jgi:hypothetical protein